MKLRRPPTAILLLFLAALAAWFALRPHPASPLPAREIPADRPNAGPSASPTPAAASPIPAAPRGTPVVAPTPPTQTPGLVGSSLTTPAPPRAAESVGSAPDAPVPNPSRADSASINALRVRRMVTDYHTLTGENPVGTNAEIMAAVMGKNPRQAILGPPDGVSLNPQGELVDEWGTPYFFHQLSRDVMEIHSAGPDKIMGTADDVVVR